jgi:FkbM family methyltransferase
VKLSLAHRVLRVCGHLPLPWVRGAVRRLHRSLGLTRSLEFEATFVGLRFRGRLDDFIDWNVFFFGNYCPEELDFLAAAARVIGGSDGGVTYFDVGANIGHHALFMSRRASQVVAFEPSASARERFSANVHLNGLANIRLFAMALGDADGEAQLGSGFKDNSGSRSLCWTLDRDKDETVIVRRGDDLFCEEELPRVDILKLDVEGYEKRVLAGLRETLLRDRPIILIELVGDGVKGGFRDEADLRQSLYPTHDLFTLRGTSRARLVAFDWNEEAAVCFPRERTRAFDRLFARSSNFKFRKAYPGPAAGRCSV